MSKFNEYLKYVKGHSADATSIDTALPDRLSTAIARRFAEEINITDVPLFKITKVSSYADFIHIVCKPIGGYKRKIDINLEDYTITITHKAKGEYNSEIFTDNNIYLHTSLRHFIDLEDYFDTEADNEVSRYFRDGIDKIGMINAKINIIVIAILENLETNGFFIEYEPVLYYEYRSSSDPAYVDNDNTKADESANSMI